MKYHISTLRAWTKTGIAVSALALQFIGGPAHAATTTVFVNGASGPWDFGPNPSFVYGLPNDGHLSPTVVTAASSGLSFATGSTLTIAYFSGTPLAGANGTALGTGGTGVPGYPLFVPPCTLAPSCFMGVSAPLEEFLGTFANSGGTIVGTPFLIGNGPVSEVIPVGASELLLGFNDENYADNGLGIEATVSGDGTVAAIPEPATPALMLLGLAVVGGAGIQRARRR